MVRTHSKRILCLAFVLQFFIVLAFHNAVLATWPRISPTQDPYEIALSYYQAGEYDAALPHLDTALKADPQNPKIRFLRGQCYRETWQLAQAMADYEHVIRMNPRHAEAHHGRGLIADYRGYWDEAIDDYTKAVQFDSNIILPYVYRAAIYRKRGQYAKADADLTRAIQRCNGRIHTNRNDMAAYRARALAYFTMEQYDQAIEDYGQMIRIDPTSIEAHIERGRSHAQKKDKTASVADLDRAIQLATAALGGQKPNPHARRLRIKAHDARAFAWKDPLDFQLAVADCNTLLKQEPNSAALYFRRGHLCGGASHFSGDPKAAVAYFSQAEADLGRVIEIDRTYAAAWHERSLLYLRAALSRQQPKLALRGVNDLTEMLRLVPKSALAHCARGSAYGLAGNYRKALDDFNRAVRLCPQMADAYALRGGANLALGNEKAYHADMARANELRTKTR